MEFAEACGGLGLRPITGAELTVALAPADGADAHLTLLVERHGRVPQPLPAADRRPRPHPRQPAAQRRAAVGDAGAGGGARRGARLPLRLRPRRGARRGLGAAATRRAGSGSAGGCSRPSGRERFRVELQRPFWRHDRARNRWLALLAERLGVALRRDRQRPLPRPPPHPPAGRLRRGPPGRDAGGVRAAAARQPQLGAGLARGDGGALRRAPRGRRRDRAPRRAARASTSPRSSATATPARRTPSADRELAEPLRAPARRALRGRRRAAPRPKRRLEQELATIRHLDLSGFFLLHHELLELAREVAVEVRGRGLAALGAAARARPRLQRQLDRLLPDRPLPHRPGRGRPLRRSLPQRRSDRRCPTSTSTSRATSARC